MRPGYLYFTTFAWLVFTGGRFTAPFLQEVAGFDDALIGIAIASQMLIGSLLGSIGAVVSDRLEFKFPNRGRIYCLASGILLGTVAFELHWVVQFMFRGEKNNSARTLHFLARMLYSISSSIIFPILDGITLSYLKSNVDGDGMVAVTKSQHMERSASLVLYLGQSVLLLLGPHWTALALVYFFVPHHSELFCVFLAMQDIYQTCRLDMYLAAQEMVMAMKIKSRQKW